jgi:glycosyltransferase involved in cell wall biosynthesis
VTGAGAPPVRGAVRDRDILCLSTQDWDDLWTRKQRFMREFARRGNRVLYVEAQASLASIGLVARDPGRMVRFLAGPREVEPGLHVATLPLVLPFFQMSLAVNRANNALLAPLLRRWMRGLGFRRPVLWTYAPHSESLVGRLGESLAVYDCVDELGETRGLVRAEVVRELERRLLGKVAAVVVTHENLLRSKSAPGRSVHLVPNGAEIEHFAKASDVDTPLAPEMENLPRPVIGFLGSVQYWIDFDLLRFLALARPNWSFVLIGPKGRLARVDRIEKLANVHLLGRKRYEELPAFVKGFDVCLNPYVRGEHARNCSPLKLYEYLASGRPVVSVDMPEATKFQGVIGIGRTDEEILLRLEEALRLTDDDVSARARRQAVAPHSWDCRFRELEAALLPCLLQAPDRAGKAET